MKHLLLWLTVAAFGLASWSTGSAPQAGRDVLWHTKVTAAVEAAHASKRPLLVVFR